MQPKHFSKREAISFGWNTAKKNVGFFFVIFILALAVNFTVSYIRETATLFAVNTDMILGVITAVLLSIAAFLVNQIVQIGLIKIPLKLYDNEKPQFSDLFSSYPLVLKYIAAAILMGLVILGAVMVPTIIGGIIFFIFQKSNPAVAIISMAISMLIAVVFILYLSIRLQFYSYLIVDKGMGPIEALKKSSELTKGVVLNLVGFSFVLAGVNILGALAFLIGLLWTVPTTMVAGAYVYRKLLAQTEGTPTPITVQQPIQSPQPTQPQPITPTTPTPPSPEVPPTPPVPLVSPTQGYA